MPALHDNAAPASATAAGDSARAEPATKRNRLTNWNALPGRIWNSPMFTSWGNKAAQSLRFLVLVPLILSRFNEVEVASWFMFSTLLFFSSILDMQVCSVFFRMVALANGGATDLSPVTGGNHQTSQAPQNWSLISRIYGTMQSLNLATSVLTSAVVLALGLLSVAPILRGYGDADSVWLAFGIFMVGNFFNKAFRYYSVTLRGLNKVALVNRWEIVFSILSSISGGVVLWFGGGIVQLTLVMQGFMLLGIVRMWLLLHFVAEPRFRQVKPLQWDKAVVRWSWTPLWKGIVQMTANRGSSKICAIFLAQHADPSTLAALLLSLQLLDSVDVIALTPSNSNAPRFSTWLAQGNIAAFRRGMLRAIRIGQWIQCLSIIAIGLGAHAALSLIQAEVDFLPTHTFFTLAVAYLMVSTIRQMLNISLIGNHVVAAERFLAAALVTLATGWFLTRYHPAFGFIACAYLPAILFVNTKSLTTGAKLLQMPAFTLYRSTALLPHTCLLFAIGCAYLTSGALTR